HSVQECLVFVWQTVHPCGLNDSSLVGGHVHGDVAAAIKYINGKWGSCAHKITYDQSGRLFATVEWVESTTRNGTFCSVLSPVRQADWFAFLFISKFSQAPKKKLINYYSTSSSSAIGLDVLTT